MRIATAIAIVCVAAASWQDVFTCYGPRRRTQPLVDGAVAVPVLTRTGRGDGRRAPTNIENDGEREDDPQDADSDEEGPQADHSDSSDSSYADVFARFGAAAESGAHDGRSLRGASAMLSVAMLVLLL